MVADDPVLDSPRSPLRVGQRVRATYEATVEHVSRVGVRVQLDHELGSISIWLPRSALTPLSSSAPQAETPSKLMVALDLLDAQLAATIAQLRIANARLRSVSSPPGDTTEDRTR